LDVASGPHDGDRQSLPKVGYAYEDAIETLDVRGLRAVWSPDYGYAAVDPEVEQIALAAAERLIAEAHLIRCSNEFKPNNIYSHWGAIFGSTLEADFIKDGYLPDGYDMMAKSTQRLLNKVRARKATLDISASWKQVHLLERQVAEFFSDHDLLMSPATACAPYGADDPVPSVIGGKDSSQGGAEPFGMLANACWNPAISIPAGFTAAGLPVGLQIVARRHRDDILLRLARIVELSSPWPLISG
jgi:aspartyl-tRNA(Asn)/glutamyl-tRNA(Gln) amidotransferase subunit A